MISERHRQLYQQHYKGRTVAPRPNPWLHVIERLAREIEARDILDYGCGISRGVSRFSSYPVRDFDPGVPECAAPPTAADFVVSIHALEHVEPDMIDAVLLHMQSLARKAILLVVSCEASTKLLPDGSPWHSFVKPASWWHHYLTDYVPIPPKAARLGAEYAGIWRAA
ncbi:MAG: hypothetical protein KAY22_05525 [Rhizorhabdus sp.]|uniref:hypothetical protein n=1 Tax=Rhizorhabdus sp. TaxID=1968843 RepID=UPI001B581571|nr:hypothetical protein [Rhizorhabdus sp.]MBP8231745.1 hypothetical protein [Rhizorhabdus sp.]